MRVVCESAFCVFCTRTHCVKFANLGSCAKDTKCRFAHYTHELLPPPNLYKTKMCPAVSGSGICRGRGCRYAHQECELRSIEVLEKEQEVMRQRMIEYLKVVDVTDVFQWKTAETPDKLISEGDMPILSSTLLVAQCSDGSRTEPATVMIVAESTKAVSMAGSEAKDQFQRTQLCKFYSTGNCKLGHACKFAHGHHQLRLPLDTSNNDQIVSTSVQPHSDTLIRRHGCSAPQDTSKQIPLPVDCLHDTFAQAELVLPPAGFTGEDGDLIVRNTFLTVASRYSPSRRCSSLPTRFKMHM